MSSLEKNLLAITQRSADTFCRELSKIEPVAAGFVTASLASMPLLVGFAVELANTHDIQQAYGPQALRDYTASSHELSALQYVSLAMADALPSAGQNIIGKSLAALMTLPIIAECATAVARRVQGLKDQVELLEQGGRQVSRGDTKPVEYKPERSGATRTNDPSAFERQFDALSKAIEKISIQEEQAGLGANSSKKPRGLG